MSLEEKYDSIVIGSGQAGGPLSTDLVKAGRKTALIESRHVGGTCINDGCTPTKTMIASARVAYLNGRSRDYGITIGATAVHLSAIRRRKDEIVARFREGSTRAIEGGGVDLIHGRARFIGPDGIEVRTDGGDVLRLTAREFFINTGCRPARPPLPGLETVSSLDSTTIMDLDSVPEHLLILGGGYVGLEFGQMFRRFGSLVSIVQRGPELLGREDHDIAHAVADIMRDDGIELYLSSSATRVEAGNNGSIRLVIKTGAGEEILTGTHLLVAVGRVPNTEDLELDAADVESDEHGFVCVNDRLETRTPHIWGLGDVAGSPPFTHVSYDDFRIVRENLLRGGNRTRKDRIIPYTVFIDPQLGRVGLTEVEAKKQGRRVKVASMKMSHVARAIEVDEQRGLVKAIVDADTGEILGASVLGLEGGEIMAMFEIAMMGKLPYPLLRDGIFAHPTLAELMNNLFGSI